MKILPIRKWGIVCLCCLLLTGCWDSLEIEKRTLAVSLAVDKEKEDFVVSIQVPNPRQIAGGGEGGGGGQGGPEAIEIFTGTGKTIGEALIDIQSKTNYPVFFGHAQTFFVSEAVAKSGLSSIIDFLRRSPQVRRQLWPIVVKGKAMDALQTQVKLEQIPTDYMRHLIEMNVRPGRIPEITLGDVLIDLSTPWKHASILYYIEAKKNAFEWLGMAVFKRDKMVGVLDIGEATPLLQLRYGKRGFNFVAPCGNGRKGITVFRPKEIERKIDVSAKPSIDIRISLVGDVEEKTCPIYIKDPSDYRKLNQQIAREFEMKGQTLVQKAKRQLNTDIFQLGDYIHAYHPDLWKRLDWEKDFARIPINVHYSVNVGRVGLEAQ